MLPRPPIREPEPGRGVRRVVQESWERSLRLQLDPDQPLADDGLPDAELREYRDAHPLALVLPTVRQLLVRHAIDANLIVAIGDQAGRLLWIDGDRTLRHKAESMLFVEGADWSEPTVGTSAPGTALALGQSMQIYRTEHFNRIVHPWSCTAVPVHDPLGAILGVIDITGGDDAVAPVTLALIEATVAAVEGELRMQRLEETLAASRRPIASRRPDPAVRSLPHAPLLRVLGSDRGHVEYLGTTAVPGNFVAAPLALSLRHAEILTLLAWHPHGLTTEALGELLYDGDEAAVTVRAEMVRLRKLLQLAAPHLVPLSRPYRLAHPLELDAQRVLAFLERGAHKVALGIYAGAVLPQSDAPGILAIRAEVSARLRAALLTDASAETLLAYAHLDEAAYDADVWRACLDLLPPRSPKRAAVVARIEFIDATVGLPPRR